MHEEMKTRNSAGGAAFKALILAAFIVAAVAAVRWTPLRELVSVEQLGGLLNRAGYWAPLAYVCFYVLGVCLFVPGTLLTAIGAAIFGVYWGFILTWLGAMAGATVSFYIGRYLGREFAASLIGERLKKYDDAIERNGFATVLYLRLAYFPFTPMNFGMGLTKVAFRDYFWGTALGIVVGTFVFTFFVGTVRDVYASGDWKNLVSWQIGFALALFVFSFFIPKLVSRIKDRFGLRVE
ncbi:MAG: TVP38/TMEM64 family protein [Syntrophobacteraceae bacterium]